MRRASAWVVNCCVGCIQLRSRLSSHFSLFFSVYTCLISLPIFLIFHFSSSFHFRLTIRCISTDGVLISKCFRIKCCSICMSIAMTVWNPVLHGEWGEAKCRSAASRDAVNLKVTVATILSKYPCSLDALRYDAMNFDGATLSVVDEPFGRTHYTPHGTCMKQWRVLWRNGAVAASPSLPCLNMPFVPCSEQL